MRSAFVKNIKKSKLRYWLVEYITDNVHRLKVKKREISSKEFNAWAKSFKREEADFLVGMEIWEWEEDSRNEFPLTEIIPYADKLLQRVLDNWYK